MKIETKLTFNNIRKNFKRTIYTTISIILCSFLIIATILIATSIGTGIKENIASEYNDYHFIIKNLDSKSSNEIIELLKKTNKEYNQTIMMITHNMEIAKQADRIIKIEDGRFI